MGRVDVEKLNRSALWIIIDPWLTSPNMADNLRDPDLDKRNETVIIKIADYLHRLEHVLISCDWPVHPLVKHLDHIDGTCTDGTCTDKKFQSLIEYTEKNNIKDIVYTGFHHGMCILYDTSVGAKKISLETDLSLYIKRDLVGTVSWVDKNEMDEISSPYANLI
jgi:hypothetical protein